MWRASLPPPVRHQGGTRDGSRRPRGSKAVTESLWSLSSLGTQAGRDTAVSFRWEERGGLGSVQMPQASQPRRCTDTLGWRKELKGRKGTLALAALHCSLWREERGSDQRNLSSLGD